MAETFQVGQVRKITIADTSELDGTITKIQAVGNDDDKCLLVTYYIEGYGETQPYMYGGKNNNDPEERIARSQMPSWLMDKTMTDFNWTVYGEDISLQRSVADAFIEQYDEFERKGKGLYIFSKCKGSGKTFLACVLANEIVRRKNFPMRFINSTDYVELIKGKDEESQNAVNDLYKCRLLVLDDIGAQDDKQQWINESLFRLIDFRYREKRPVIFTSNCDIDALKGDDRIVDRIEAMSVPVKMPEKRVRKIIADADTKAFLEKVMKS